MLWPKNRAAEQKPPALPSQKFPETLIAGLGHLCVSGDQPFALLGAVGTDISGVRLDRFQTALLPDLSGEAAVLTAPIKDLEEIDTAAERILSLAYSALAQAVAGLPQEGKCPRSLVHLRLPPMDSARGCSLNHDELESVLRTLHPALEEAAFQFSRATGGGVEELTLLCHELKTGKWDIVLFGGADSMVDPLSCSELAQQERLLTEGRSEGLAPGEAAAFLLLQSPTRTVEPARAWASIAGAAHLPEPHSGKAAEKKTTALVQAMEDAAAQAGFKAAEMKEFVLTLSTETASELEWHQTFMKTWPPCPPENEWDEPENPQILRLHYALGELGAAAFPLAIVLGCARSEFEHPPLESLLVCDGGDAPVRGAVCLAFKEGG